MRNESGAVINPPKDQDSEIFRNDSIKLIKQSFSIDLTIGKIV